MSQKQPASCVEYGLIVALISIGIISSANILGPKELTEQEKRERKDICTEATALRNKFENSAKTKIELEIVDDKGNKIDCAASLQKLKP